MEDIRSAKASPEQIEQLIGSALFVTYTADCKAGMRTLNFFHEWKKPSFFKDKIKRKEYKKNLVARCIELTDLVASKPVGVIQNMRKVVAATDASLENGTAVMGGIDEEADAYTISTEMNFVRRTIEEAWGKPYESLAKDQPEHI